MDIGKRIKDYLTEQGIDVPDDEDPAELDPAQLDKVATDLMQWLSKETQVGDEIAEASVAPVDAQVLKYFRRA